MRVGAETAGVGYEVEVSGLPVRFRAQVVEARVTRGVLQALDAAEPAVVEQYDDQLRTEAHGGRDLAVEHEIRPVSDHHDHFALGLRELHAEGAGDLVAHAGVAILQVVPAGMLRPPVAVQLTGQSAGGLPGELHRHWRAEHPGGYHLEYGYSCMGYEIAGALGVKLAQPEREVIVMVGDGSYLMLNSEIATSVRLGAKLIIVLLDNGGFGCIERLQNATGNASFNNLRTETDGEAGHLDLVTHARSLGAHAHRVPGIAALADALSAARQADRTSVLVIQTDPAASTTATIVRLFNIVITSSKYLRRSPG